MDDRHWSRQTDALLHLLRQPRFGIISDFDGTLSAFTDLPGQAVIVPEIADLVDRLADKVEVFAFVSGRGVSDLRDKFARPWAVYYGNHGIEYWSDGGPQNAPQVHDWVEPLQQMLATLDDLDMPGMLVENKGATAAVHYRMTDNPDTAREQLRDRLQPLCEQHGFVLSSGNFIFEISPPVHLHKGTAAQAIVEDHRLTSALFLGDDVTDINAMRRLRELAAEPGAGFDALSVGVLHAASPPAIHQACDLTADGVEDVARLLRWIEQNRASTPTLSNT